MSSEDHLMADTEQQQEHVVVQGSRKVIRDSHTGGQSARGGTVRRIPSFAAPTVSSGGKRDKGHAGKKDDVYARRVLRSQTQPDLSTSTPSPVSSTISNNTVKEKPTVTDSNVTATPGSPRREAEEILGHQRDLLLHLPQSSFRAQETVGEDREDHFEERKVSSEAGSSETHDYENKQQFSSFVEKESVETRENCSESCSCREEIDSLNMKVLDLSLRQAEHVSHDCKVSCSCRIQISDLQQQVCTQEGEISQLIDALAAERAERITTTADVAHLSKLLYEE
jgi:hypothetical protein